MELRALTGGRVTRVAMLAALVGALLWTQAGAASARSGTPAAAASSFSVRGSAEQVDVTGARSGARLSLSRGGHEIAAQRAGALGGALFRNVTPGAGYRVSESGPDALRSSLITVLTLRSAPPDARGYRQKLPTSGYGYLTTRDGTPLAVDVHLPGGSGPYPTLIEYSGYGYANPAGPQHGIAAIANLLGFAVVDVNMRGTGCSGGAFDFFEPLQSLDGYDVIETVARQPWVLHHRVGMMGISYGGISQLFVGATNPPSLVAIAPLSVIDNTATTLYPGGILNTGFALSWATDRVHDALPASATGGQPWALTRIQQGDQICRANQALHSEAVDLIAKVHANRFWVPSVAEPLAPITFVNRIKVPTYLACQWTDEQTGGHCADLAQHFAGTRRKWFTFTNGTHIDSLDPATFNRWYDFLELYVARRAPHLSPAIRSIAPTLYQTAMGVAGVGLPVDPIQQAPSYAAALAAFERLRPVRILFDNGAGSSRPLAPIASFEQSFSRFPLPGTVARFWYLADGGALSASSPRRSGADSFTWDPHARPPTDFTGDTSSGANGLWTTTPHYQWRQNPAGSALAYVSPALSSDTTVVGGGALQAWIRASSPNVDLQVAISEVKPDGNETFVQGGWLRTSERKLDPTTSTLLAPVPSLRRADVAPLPRGRWTPVTSPLYYEGHVYRQRSRIRITITAPGGDQPIWAFAEVNPTARANVAVAFSTQMPSRLILPVVPGIHVRAPLPPCPGLRAEPCRLYRPFANRGA